MGSIPLKNQINKRSIALQTTNVKNGQAISWVARIDIDATFQKRRNTFYITRISSSNDVWLRATLASTLFEHGTYHNGIFHIIPEKCLSINLPASVSTFSNITDAANTPAVKRWLYLAALEKKKCICLK